MKRLVLTALILLLSISAAGCGGVDQETYDALVAENGRLAGEIEANAAAVAAVAGLKEENSRLQTDIKVLESELSKLKSDYEILGTYLNEASANVIRQNGLIFQLRDALTNTYNAYRNMAIFVTTEAASGTLTMAEWEPYFISKDNQAPPFDEVNALMTD